jgi:Tol biopolymer transport system component
MPSELTVVDVLSGERRVLLSTHRHIQAPNWTPDGVRLIVNSEGALLTVDAERGGDPALLTTPGLPPVNNDHVLAPDGTTYASAVDGHIYAVADCAAVRRVTNDEHPQRRLHFLHGVSADGGLLAYVAIENPPAGWTNAGLWTIPAIGGEDRLVAGGVPPKDGPEFSPDGAWLYFNGDVSLDELGRSQIFRVSFDDGTVEQITDDGRVNWFPHVSPDGARMVHLSYPPGTKGHPADLDVLLRLSDPEGGGLVEVARLRGGQGTINVPSWAPDSRRFAYVAYPV